MKFIKLLLPVLTLGMLTGCQLTNNSSNNNVTNDSSITNQNEAVYTFEAITGAGLLNSLQTMNQSSSPLINRAVADETLVNQIKDYLPTVEAALYDNSLMTSSTEMQSDRPEYETKIIIEYKDMSLVDQNITMYYNQTLLNNRDYDDHEKEEEYRIDGIIIVNDMEYSMFGKKELEEDEYEISFTYQIDEQNYARVEQEIENNESEYNYTLVSQGRKVYEYSLEIENNEIELKVKDKNLGVDLMEFEFLNRDNKTLILAEVLKNNQRSEIIFEKVIDSQTNQVSYMVISNK